MNVSYALGEGEMVIWDRVFSKCQLGPIDGWWFCFLVVLITERGMLKYPTKIVDLCTSPFNSINFLFHVFEVLFSGAHILRFVTSSW